MSNVYISCDMEGCSGIVDPQFCNPQGKFYQLGQAYMTADVMAAIQGLITAGVNRILVNDSHWNMTNIRIEELPPVVELISGGTKIDSMAEGLDSTFDAVVLTGYHPRWGTAQGVLAHTYSGEIMEVCLNGRPVGETGLIGGLAGYYGVPVIFVSGDRTLGEEVRALNTSIRFAITKEGITRTAGLLIHPDKVHETIRLEVETAWREREKIDPVTFAAPAELMVTFKETQMADMCLRLPGVTRDNNLTVSFQHEDYLTVYRALLAMLSIAESSKIPSQ
jgi:D-amino peptidase